MTEKDTLSLGRPMLRQSGLLATVFEVSYRRLVVQLYGVCGSFGEAEDLVQEAFLRASAAGRRFERGDNHEAWLRRTAVNLHRSRWRKRRNLGRVWPRLVQQAMDPPDPVGLEQHVAVIEALRRLPDAQREVLALHYFADLPLAEIADTLGIAEGTVKSRLARGREGLAALMEEVATDE